MPTFDSRLVAAASSAHAFLEKGLFLDAARVIDQAKIFSPDVLVLRALLESYVGNPHDALRAAHNLLRPELALREQLTCWEVIGRVSLSTGKIADGLRAMRKAFEAADLLQDAQTDARLLASYAESLLHCVASDAAALELPKLRQAAIKAGDAFSIIEFHSLDAEIKAKKGLLAAASSGIATAREVLKKFPHVGQEAKIGVISTGLAVIQGDYRSGLAVATETLSHARSAGIRTVLVSALNNFAYIKLSLNEFHDVEQPLRELLDAAANTGATEIGVRDTEMMFAMARNDLGYASQVADAIASLISSREANDSYYELWHQPTRIRLMYRLGATEAALALALDTLPRAERKLDHVLVARLRLLASEGFVKVGKSALAAIQIAQAVNSNADPSLEFIADSHRVSGRLLSNYSAPDADAHFSQAAAILRGIGNFAAEADVERDKREAIHEAESAVTDRFGQTCQRITSLLELGAHIPTLATESVGLIAQTNCTRKVEAVENFDGRARVLRSIVAANGESQKSETGKTVIINLGSYQTRQYQVRCFPVENPAARIMLLSLERLISAALAIEVGREIAKERQALLPDPAPEQQLGLICSSERMLDLVQTIRRVATSNVTILLTGETGVGKELFARALHQASARSDKVFLPFNCGTVPRDLIDSQLFGHRRGAFTGAHADAAGVIRSAAGGTLFLDEIGDMAIETQPKLLRFLEAGEILPLGETKPQQVDVRIVAATNANLDQMVADGRFREDLYYRLNVIRINIPPLRERREEIPALVEHFLERFGRELHKPMLRVADETLEYLVLYRWPGNVRQLANEVHRMVALAEPGSVLMPAHLSDAIVASRKTIPVGHAPRGFSEVLTRIDQPLSAAVEHVERAAIQRAMSITDGNLIEAAKMLGLSRKGLYLKRQRLNLT